MSDPTELRGYRKPYPGTQPPRIHLPYASTAKRGPSRDPIAIPVTLSEVTGPTLDRITLGAHAADLTAGFAGEPLGERIIVSGRVLDENGRPVRNSVVEVWQCNAAGRYLHKGDQHDAPLDPNFKGTGQVLTDAHGRYRFTTIKPGAYPWRNHYNAWRPAHIHFSLHGEGIGQRLAVGGGAGPVFHQPGPVDDAGQPSGDRADHPRDGGEQEHRRDRQLDAVGDGCAVQGKCHGMSSLL